MKSLVCFLFPSPISARFLGYAAAAADLSRERERRQLLKSMHKLAIDPFTQESVDSYKTRRGNEVSSPSWYGDRMAQWILVAVFSGVASVVLLFNAQPWWSLLSLFATVVGISRAALLRIRLGPERRAVWHNHPLAEYIVPIPEHATQTAVDIKQACREACLEVERLSTVTTSDGRTECQYPDSFLVVSIPGCRRYFIDVWGETDFGWLRT